jgi:O-antigen/teichoic acid export membrane protein
MTFAIVFFLNAAANFAFGVVLSALLGPAEFGRYATVALAAGTVAAGVFEWLRQSSIRFSGQIEDRARIAATLDAGYLVAMALLYVGVGVSYLCGQTFGVTPGALALTPLLAVALSRLDYAGAWLRARERPRPFALLYGLRQALCFCGVASVAWFTRDSTLTVGALAFCTLLPAVVVGVAMRTPGAGLKQASARHAARFFVYAKPIVLSLVLYQLVVVVNRQAALLGLGAEATGQLSLATDLGQRLFLALNTLPEFLLFQYALKREREEGRASAERQVSFNVTVTLALLIPLTAGYVAMMPTFQALLVPAAYRGPFADLSWRLAPGFLAFCAISSTCNPVFQLAQRTWPTIIAAACALLVDFALLRFSGCAASVEGLASATSVSLVAGWAVASTLAMRNRNARPRLNELAAIMVAAAAMVFAVEPLNALSSHGMAAGAALVVGVVVYGGLVLVFDVAGLRRLASAQWRARAQHERVA